MFILLCCLVCSLQPCYHLLRKGLPIGSLACYIFGVFVTFPYGVPGQVCFLIGSIPDFAFFSNKTIHTRGVQYVMKTAQYIPKF